MSNAATRSPKHPPPWFVHTAWRIHRALYRLSGGRFLWTTSNKRGWGALRLTTIGRKSGQERSVIIGASAPAECRDSWNWPSSISPDGRATLG